MSRALALVVLCALAGCSKSEATPSPTSGAPERPVATTSKLAPVDPPDAVAKRYLELGAAGDLSKIKELVDPKCVSTKIGDVDAVKMLGARMTLTETSTTLESPPGETANVKYTVKGSIDAKESQTETDILGKKATIKVGSISMKGVTQSGTLDLVKIDGRWVVTCR